MYYFYRNPIKNIPKIPLAIVAPSDGTILKISSDTKYIRIAIFLSPWDVHVQYAPYSGKITKQIYRKGTFHPAYLFRKSNYNEQLRHCLTTFNGLNLWIIQIAGVITRRIVSFVQSGDIVNKGELLGMIKLGSRVDLILPKDMVRLTCFPQQKFVGGETVIAYFIPIN